VPATPSSARVETLLAAHEGAGRFLDPDATAASESAPVQTLQEPASSATDTVVVSQTSPSETQLATDQFSTEHQPDGAIAAFAGAPAAARSGASAQGQVIAGRYTLREALGEGGMGTVYRADQTEPVRRQVALKLIKFGMDSRAVLARFDAERQALALMDHPNIARVYDGGTTAAGQPFFVMELVRGEPITAYCDRRRLPVRARLELFVAACQAVQHAHQKGIIHRDLKPSNILVTEVDGRPTPKVIDFGVAKATEFQLTEQSLADAGAIVGTPAYMSPEQAEPSSMDIDTRTDVYALGVILYELLAGSPPIDAKQFKRGAVLEMLRMVREVEPSRPSTKVSTAVTLPSIAASRNIEPARLKQVLRGDLDWIVMKALEKDRARRYETASGFAADVLRHLASEPVVAAPPSRVYRMTKFVRKHRGGVVAAALVVFALVAGMAGTTWGLIRESKANAELAKVNAELGKANSDLTRSKAAVQARYELAVDAIKTFHTGVSEDFLLKEEKFKNLRDRLLESASDFYQKLGAILKDAADFPSWRALLQANYEVADLTNTVGRKDAALAAHRRVLAAQEALAAEPQADAATKADVARSLTAIATLLEGIGRTDEAVATYRKAASLLAPAAGSARVAAPAMTALADCRSRLGYLLYSTGHAADGLLVLRQARTDQEALAQADGAAKDAWRDFANTVNRIGNLLSRTGRPSEAAVEYRKSLVIYEQLVHDNPAVTRIRDSLANSHLDLGILLLQSGRPLEAEAEQRKAIALYQKLTHDNPEAPNHRFGLAGALYCLGDVIRPLGRAGEAKGAYERAIAIHERLVKESPTPWYRGLLARSLRRRGLALGDLGDPVGAAADLQRALSLYDGLPSRSAEEWFETACCHAALAGGAGHDGASASAGEGEQEADKAIELLRRAAAVGYRNANAFRTESALTALYHRGDFRLLMMDLAMPPERFAR
jgi:eukaryotic-like serine/threonine-protein kinase